MAAFATGLLPGFALRFGVELWYSRLGQQPAG